MNKHKTELVYLFMEEKRALKLEKKSIVLTGWAKLSKDKEPKRQRLREDDYNWYNKKNLTTMKLFIPFIFFIILIASCEKKNKLVDFSVENKTSQSILIYSCAYSRTSNGAVTLNCRTDMVNSTQILSLRELAKDKPENVLVEDMFETMDITKNGNKATKNVFDNTRWIKTISDDRVTYVLTVDSTFF